MTNRNFLVLRLLTSFIFIYAGTKHLVNTDAIYKRVSGGTMYQMAGNESLFKLLILSSGAIMIAGAIMLIAGYQQKWAAGILLVMLTGITLAVQLENLNDLGPFFKNVAIAGSLLFILNTKSHESKEPIINPVSLR